MTACERIVKEIIVADLAECAFMILRDGDPDSGNWHDEILYWEAKKNRLLRQAVRLGFDAKKLWKAAYGRMYREDKRGRSDG